MQASALDGVKILDFSRVLAGPFATMILADLGAQVTKVERPEVGDETRGWGPPYDPAGRSTYFYAANRNKRSTVLDLQTEAGRDHARLLAGESDIVVENFRPGLMDEFGLGYEQLTALNPRLIYCSITGFGRSAGAMMPGYDLLIQALGGLMSITGSADGDPTKVGVALVDVLAGLFATIGMLAALEHRRDSGNGQRVEVDLLTTLLASLANQATAYTVGGVVPERLGNRHPSVAPYEPFRTGEGDLVLAVGNDRQFRLLCEVIGASELATDERYATNAARVENAAALAAELESRLASRPAPEWAHELTARRVPAGVVNDIGAAFALARQLGLEPTTTMAGVDGEEITLPRNPIRLSVTPATYRMPPPPLGDSADSDSEF